MQHVFSLGKLKPQADLRGGSRAEVNASNFPVLKGLSLYRLILKPQGVREPHWHPNAHELTYCVRGQALVTVFSNGSQHDTFTLAAGEMFFVPTGYLHHIENTGSGEAEFIIGFSNESPEDIGMSAALGCMTDAVLGNTYAQSAAAFAPLKRSTNDTLIGVREGVAKLGDEFRAPNPHKFAIEAMTAPIDTAHGSAKTAKKSFWPLLEDISMFSVRIPASGMREPHWHPRTAEMGYVLSGKARMTLLTPGVGASTWTLEAGDVYFIPPAYPHHIEDMGEGETRFLIFFDRAEGEDIGYTAGLRAYSNEVLAATFGCEAKFFEKLPSYESDLFFVERRNPRDP